MRGWYNIGFGDFGVEVCFSLGFGVCRLLVLGLVSLVFVVLLWTALLLDWFCRFLICRVLSGWFVLVGLVVADIRWCLVWVGCLLVGFIVFVGLRLIVLRHGLGVALRA